MCCLHSGEKVEWVAGEQNSFPRETVWLTDPSCSQLPVKCQFTLEGRPVLGFMAPAALH